MGRPGLKMPAEQTNQRVRDLVRANMTYEEAFKKVARVANVTAAAVRTRWHRSGRAADAAHANNKLSTTDTLVLNGAAIAFAAHNLPLAARDARLIVADVLKRKVSRSTVTRHLRARCVRAA